MIGNIRSSFVSAVGPRAVHAAERGFVVGAVLTLSITYPPLAFAVLAAVADASEFPDVLGAVGELTEGNQKAIRSQTIYYLVALLLGAGVGGVGGRWLEGVVPYASII